MLGFRPERLGAVAGLAEGVRAGELHGAVPHAGDGQVDGEGEGREAAIERLIVELSEAVPFAGDLCAFAAARFDYMLANPQVRRLAAWRTFERAGATPAEIESYRVRVEAVAAAQRAGEATDGIPALDLFAMVLRLTESWLSAPPGLQAVGGDDPLAAERLSEHRAALIEAVRRIAEPSSTPPSR